MMSYRDLMRSEVPDGESGNCKISRYVVSEDDAKFSAMRASFSFTDGGRYVPAGEYTELLIDGAIMMSDTPDEIMDHVEPVRRASGTCLVTGLGLGCVVRGMLEKRREDGSFVVDKVIVIEKNEHVIRLVAPYFQDRYGDRFEVRCYDALVYVPPQDERYDVVWHDIWPNICEDNLKTMGTLHRKYGRKCNWQGSWQRENILRGRRQEKNRASYWR